MIHQEPRKQAAIPKKRKILWIVECYLFGVALGCFSYVVTRGSDGNMSLLVILFGFGGLAYAVLLVRSTSRAFTFHSIGHFVLYFFTCRAGVRIDNQLTGLGEMAAVYVAYAMCAVLLFGAIANLIVRGLMPALARRRRRQQAAHQNES